MMMNLNTQTTSLPPALRWFPANLEGLNHAFEKKHPRDILRWGLAIYGRDMPLATGFGPSGIVMLHLACQETRNFRAFFLQTDLHFEETMVLRRQLERRLGIEIEPIAAKLTLEEQAGRYGPDLWHSDPDFCCQLRKVDPLTRYLAGKRAWATAIRRDQSPSRVKTPILSWDHAHRLLKICPLAGWQRDQVWDYIRVHHLPYNDLHDEGYRSIGCAPCTRPAAAGEDERAGRWAGREKTECGIHIQPDGRLGPLRRLHPPEGAG